MIVVAHNITNRMEIAITADFVPDETISNFLTRIANENNFTYEGSKSLIERQTGRYCLDPETMIDGRDYALVAFLRFASA